MTGVGKDDNCRDIVGKDITGLLVSSEYDDILTMVGVYKTCGESVGEGVLTVLWEDDECLGAVVTALLFSNELEDFVTEIREDDSCEDCVG